jgi:DNA polymerase III epsilon subunit-like protein
MNSNFNYVVLDLETTGLSSSDSEIIEVAYLVLDSKTLVVLDSWQSFVAPERTGLDAAHINGITEDMMTGAPSFSQIAPKLIAAFQGNKLIAHNGKRFDAKFLQAAFDSVGYDFFPEIIDTLEISRSFLNLSSNKQADVAKYFNIPVIEAHRARADVDILTAIFIAFLEQPEIRSYIETRHQNLTLIQQQTIVQLDPIQVSLSFQKIDAPPITPSFASVPNYSFTNNENANSVNSDIPTDQGLDLVSTPNLFTEWQKHKLDSIHTVSVVLGWVWALFLFAAIASNEDKIFGIFFSGSLYLIAWVIRMLIVNKKLVNMKISRQGYNYYLKSKRVKTR